TRRVRLDPAAGVQVDRLERSDHRPATAESVTHDPIDVLDARDAVADETVSLAKQRPLEAVEDEAFDLGAHTDDARPCTREQVRCALDDVWSRERCRDELDDGQQIRGVRGMRDEAAVSSA